MQTCKKSMQNPIQDVLNVKCGVLRNYINDLESDLKTYKEHLKGAEQIEQLSAQEHYPCLKEHIENCKKEYCERCEAPISHDLTGWFFDSNCWDKCCLDKTSDPHVTAMAVVAGMNDWAWRNQIEYLNSELIKSKYEFQLAAAELFNCNSPESKYDIEKIRAIPIKDFISRFTIIKNGFKAICPIHREKTPSLQIYEKTNSWYCFGHNNGGSVIDFVMQLNDCTLIEALDYLQNLI